MRVLWCVLLMFSSYGAASCAVFGVVFCVVFGVVFLVFSCSVALLLGRLARVCCFRLSYSWRTFFSFYCGMLSVAILLKNKTRTGGGTADVPYPSAENAWGIGCDHLQGNGRRRNGGRGRGIRDRRRK